MLLRHYGIKMAAVAKLGCFTRWLQFVLFLYLKSSKLPLSLLCYTAMLVFFQKWPKPAQLNILSLGVAMISMSLIQKCKKDDILNRIHFPVIVCHLISPSYIPPFARLMFSKLNFPSMEVTLFLSH